MLPSHEQGSSRKRTPRLLRAEGIFPTLKIYHAAHSWICPHRARTPALLCPCTHFLWHPASPCPCLEMLPYPPPTHKCTPATQPTLADISLARL